MKHVTTNVAIDVDLEGGTAVALSYVTVLQALPELACSSASGRYRGRIERRDGQGWSRSGPSRSISSVT